MTTCERDVISRMRRERNRNGQCDTRRHHDRSRCTGRIRPRGEPQLPLVDPFGRSISYLRVSMTDRCDFRCVYCMAENMAFLPKTDVLSLEELDRLCSAFVARGVRKLRLTGGEPLVRRGIMTLVASLSATCARGAGRTPAADARLAAREIRKGAEVTRRAAAQRLA